MLSHTEIFEITSKAWTFLCLRTHQSNASKQTFPDEHGDNFVVIQNGSLDHF